MDIISDNLLPWGSPQPINHLTNSGVDLQWTERFDVNREELMLNGSLENGSHGQFQLNRKNYKMSRQGNILSKTGNLIATCVR